MKELCKTGFLSFISVLAAEYIGFLIGLLLTVPVRMLFLDAIHRSVVSYICIQVSACAALFVSCRRSGYKDAVEGYVFSWKDTLPFCIGQALYVLLNVLLDYQNPSGLNALFLTEILVGSTSYSLGDLREGAAGQLFAGIAVMTFIKYPVMVWGYRMGIVKRQADRDALHGKS